MHGRLFNHGFAVARTPLGDRPLPLRFDQNLSVVIELS
jgi:hypothetical protein